LAQHRTSCSESTGYSFSSSNKQNPLLPHTPKKYSSCDKLGDFDTEGEYDGVLDDEREGAFDNDGADDGGNVGVSEGRREIDGITEGETDGSFDGTTVGISVGSLGVDDQIKSKSWPHPVPAAQFCSSSSFVHNLPLLSVQIASAVV